ncbi:MAG: hypothetical protein CL693_13995 [Cellvibrionaceae bacterium]|nr:hypothetical protein [Cellvibrionaceae bacterium]|tara:strand:- start:17357 stop:18844 length:1488 start_codon:yes stop_codon:yes gene_type:complete
MIRWLLTGLSLTMSTLALSAPNIVIITLSDPLSAPFMAQLGQTGITISHYAPAPAVSADRAALLVGRDPLRLGIAYSNIRPWDNAGIHPEEQLLVEGFKQAGYRTAFLGNWGLGHAQHLYHPLQRGFDQFAGQLLVDASPQFPYKAFAGVDLQKNGAPLKQPDNPLSHSDINDTPKSVNQWVSEELTQLLSEPSRQEESRSENSPPLLAVVSFSNASASESSAVETIIGELIAVNNQFSDSSNTLFAILNRPPLTEKSLPTPDDYLTSAVLIWPNQLPINTDFDQLVSPMDILPTLMALVDIDWRGEKSLDGIDWSPLLLSSSPIAELVARELTLVEEAPHYGSFKLLQFDTTQTTPTSPLGPILSQHIEQGFSQLNIQQQLCEDKYHQATCTAVEGLNQNGDANKSREKLSELTRQRRALHPINGVRQKPLPPPGWRSPSHWQSITLSDAILQDSAAPGDVPEVARLPLDYQLGDKGRIIYDCEPKWWAFGLCF